MSKTTILLESETRQLLRKHARKEQTYDDFIRELVVKQVTCPHCGREVEEKIMSESGSHGLPTDTAVRHGESVKSKGEFD